MEESVTAKAAAGTGEVSEFRDWKPDFKENRRKTGKRLPKRPEKSKIDLF